MKKNECTCQENGQEQCAAHVKRFNRFWKCEDDHYDDELNKE